MKLFLICIAVGQLFFLPKVYLGLGIILQGNVRLVYSGLHFPIRFSRIGTV